MCGIAGIVDYNTDPKRSEIMSMLDIISYRGPDSYGTLFENSIAIGMRRLAIIDVSSGNQPMFSQDKSLAVIFNGEIYNYIELRSELLKSGYNFNTNSDTEVIVNAYHKSNVGMFDQLNGMFSFAIYDKLDQSILICRDRLGIKPLYYYYDGTRFIFSSEIKSILTNNISTELDEQSINDYLLIGYVPRQNTIYKNIKKLLPGHYLKINKDGLNIKKWWSLKSNFSYGKDRKKVSPDELINIFDDSVKLRMRSDVPVGTFLSGGVDSSLITATASNFTDKKLNTFSIKYSKAVVDETKYSNMVSKKFHTNHILELLDFNLFNQLAPQLIWQADQPTSDSTIVPHYLVSQIASQKVKVCLSGLGGDELFGGYQRYIGNRMGRGWLKYLFNDKENLAKHLGNVLGPFSPRIGKQLNMISKDNLLWTEHFIKVNSGYFSKQDLQNLGINSSIRYETILEEIWKKYDGYDNVSRRQFVDLNTYLPDQLLSFTDTMSMACSLEVRVPFLDHRLISLAGRISGHQKNDINDRHTFKQFLKSALGDRVPEKIINRKKQGFVPPVVNWIIQDDFFNSLKNLPNKLKGVFDPAHVSKLVSTKESVFDNHRRVWSLICFYIWNETHKSLKKPNKTLLQYLS